MNSQDTFHQSRLDQYSQSGPTGETPHNPLPKLHKNPLLQELGYSQPPCREKKATGTLSDYIEEYLSDCYGLSPGTQNLYATHLNRLLETVGDEPIARVDASILRSFMAGLRRCDGKKYSPSFLDQVYRTLHTFFEWLVKEQVLLTNPLIRVRRVKVPKRKSPRLKLNEVEQLVEGVKTTQHAVRNLALVYLMMESGLRKGEVIGLCVSDLNFEEETVTVLGKDKEEREVPMNRETIEAVKAYLEERPDSTSQQLFLKVNGEPLTPDGLASLMHRLKAQAELPQLHCHLLRHTFANHYIAGGGSLRRLQKALGHNDVSTTAAIYTDPELAELKKEHAEVSPLARVRKKKEELS